MDEKKSLVSRLTRSSDGSGNLSTTIKGILLGVAPIIILVFGFAPEEINGFIDIIVEIIEKGLGLISLIVVVWGLGKKLYHKRFVG